MISVTLLALLLFSASIIHLVNPSFFLVAFPAGFPAPEACVTLTGLLELVAAGALLYPKWRRQTANWVAVYFISLIPVHCFVAAKGIPIAGVSSPFLLWLRAVLQGGLIYWAFSIARKSPPSRGGWTAQVLILAAVYNVVFGLWAIFFPAQAFLSAGMPPPNYPELWQCIGMIVGVYGVGYAIASFDPHHHWPIVLVGLLGKIFGPIGFLYSLWHSALPLSFGAVIITNDFIWWGPFAVILWSAKRQRGTK